jgi:hypothetical protein
MTGDRDRARFGAHIVDDTAHHQRDRERMRPINRIEINAKAAMAKHGLRPFDEPMGDSHHTDAPFTSEDREIAELAFWLGGLFIDKQDECDPSTALYKNTYWYKEMTSLDVWARVARALRIHGLKIVNTQGDR